MRESIFLLAALSLAFNLAQVEARCNHLNPCQCELENEPADIAVRTKCGCECIGHASCYKTPGCQLFLIEPEEGAKRDPWNPTYCKETATSECREAVHQLAKTYTEAVPNPEDCIEQPDYKYILRMAENCTISGSGKENTSRVVTNITVFQDGGLHTLSCTDMGRLKLN